MAHPPHHHPAFKSLESIDENESDASSCPVCLEPSENVAKSHPVDAMDPDHQLQPFFILPSTDTPSRCSSSPHSTVESYRCPGETPNRGCSRRLTDQLTDPVQGTTEDASVSKLSAITAGYYEDPYCCHIVKHPTRRSPIINRGYYSRVAAMRKALSTFFNAIPVNIPAVQVVSLGAGLDTTYFWVSDFWVSPTVIFYEIDFLEVLTKKASLFAKKEALWNRLGHMDGRRTVEQIEADLALVTATAINDTLYFIPADIRDVNQVERLLLLAGFKAERPTVFLSECSLIYIPGSYSDQIIRWSASITKAPSAFIIYEQINPYDTFGKTMVKNLELRGCPLLGIHDYPTLSDQKERFLTLGWDRVSLEDMNRIYDHYLDKFELVRVQNLELFDELEEWRLIQQHYFVAVAVKGSRQGNNEKQFSPEGLGYLSELATIWDTGHEQTQVMPRFTTAELRSRFRNKDHACHGGVDLLLLGSFSNPTDVSPGPLSPLMCPEGSYGLLQSSLAAQASTPMRKWSLANSESDLQALEGPGLMEVSYSSPRSSASLGKRGSTG